jgi:hypothetical protein
VHGTHAGDQALDGMCAGMGLCSSRSLMIVVSDHSHASWHSDQQLIFDNSFLRVTQLRASSAPALAAGSISTVLGQDGRQEGRCMAAAGVR